MSIEKAQQTRQSKIEEGTIAKRRNAFEQAEDNPLSKKYAIKAFCLDCAGGEIAEAKNCTVKKCYLFTVNPWRV